MKPYNAKRGALIMLIFWGLMIVSGLTSIVGFLIYKNTNNQNPFIVFSLSLVITIILVFVNIIIFGVQNSRKKKAAAKQDS